MRKRNTRLRPFFSLFFLPRRRNVIQLVLPGMFDSFSFGVISNLHKDKRVIEPHPKQEKNTRGSKNSF